MGVSSVERHWQASLSFGFPFRVSLYSHPGHDNRVYSPGTLSLECASSVPAEAGRTLSGRGLAGHYHRRCRVWVAPTNATTLTNALPLGKLVTAKMKMTLFSLSTHCVRDTTLSIGGPHFAQ